MPLDPGFDKRIKKERERSRFAANVIDVFFRSTGNEKTSTMSLIRAMFVVRKGYRVNGKLVYGRHGGKTREKKNWSEFSAANILVFLLQLEDCPFAPPKLATKTFAGKLLAQVDGVDGLRSFFQDRRPVAGSWLPRYER